MASRGAEELALVVEPGGRLEPFFQVRRPEKRPRPARFGIEVHYLPGDVDPTLLGDFLLEAFTDHQVGQVLDARGAVGGILRGRQRLGEVGNDVVPLRREIFGTEVDHACHCCLLFSGLARSPLTP
jgi:hypothetical protein